MCVNNLPGLYNDCIPGCIPLYSEGAMGEAGVACSAGCLSVFLTPLSLQSSVETVPDLRSRHVSVYLFSVLLCQPHAGLGCHTIQALCVCVCVHCWEHVYLQLMYCVLLNMCVQHHWWLWSPVGQRGHLDLLSYTSVHV